VLACRYSLRPKGRAADQHHQQEPAVVAALRPVIFASATRRTVPAAADAVPSAMIPKIQNPLTSD